ncbi:MAG TPA: response regulator transcription factor [Bryobacteraceae bacterium]|nr:response regulator transcription factor [Bryobacteraceae bacterium]
MIQVLSVDDHELTRSGIRQILGQEPDFAPIDEASDDPEALRKIEERAYDVVLLDIDMPGRSGLETLAEIRRRYPALPVLILSRYSVKQQAVRALRAGANGYLEKTACAGQLVRAIRQVASGRRYIGPEIADTLAAVVGGRTPSVVPHDALSGRELEVMRWIATGKTVSQIAAELALSVKTVSTYRARALEKMSMQSNAEFTRYAIRFGLVD